MLDIGWSELLVLAALAIVVVGPKDLPVLMRTMGRHTRRIRQVAREFRRSFDDLARETDLKSDLNDIRGAVESGGVKPPSSTDKAAAAFAPKPAEEAKADKPVADEDRAGEAAGDTPDGKRP